MPILFPGWVPAAVCKGLGSRLSWSSSGLPQASWSEPLLTSPVHPVSTRGLSPYVRQLLNLLVHLQIIHSSFCCQNTSYQKAELIRPFPCLRSPLAASLGCQDKVQIFKHTTQGPSWSTPANLLSLISCRWLTRDVSACHIWGLADSQACLTVPWVCFCRFFELECPLCPSFSYLCSSLHIQLSYHLLWEALLEILAWVSSSSQHPMHFPLPKTAYIRGTHMLGTQSLWNECINAI